MRFDVKPVSELEAEAKERQAKYAVWPKGDYDFEIIAATDGFSKSSGASMITIDVRVFNQGGRSRDLKDYLVASLQGKIHSLCTAIGIEKRYLSGNLEAFELQGCVGRCRLGIESEEYEGERRQKNKVSGYISPNVSSGTAKASGSHTARPAMPPAQPEFDDSDIPF